VVGRRGDQQRRGHGGAGDRGEEGIAQAARKLGEALLEGGGEQERQQHLDPGEHDPELLEQLDQLPVEPLARALSVGHGPSTSGSPSLVSLTGGRRRAAGHGWPP